MSVSTHISTLRKKHNSLDEKIAVEFSRPLPDFELITNLKKQKLSIKEEIVRLNGLYPEAA